MKGILLIGFFIAVIVAAKCPAQTIGFYTYPETEEGKNVTLKCDQPQLYEGSVTRLCKTGGAWANPLNTCVRNRCPTQSLIGSSIWPSTPTGENVTVGCHWGQMGYQTRHCNLDKTWAEPVNKCYECNCPENVDDVFHFTWSSGMCDVAYNKRVCPQGYDGFYQRDCSHEGNWNAVVNLCIEKACNAETDGGIFWNKTTFNTTAISKCPSGYDGNMTRFCNVNYSWETPVSFCSPAAPYIAYPDSLILGKVNFVFDPIKPSSFVNIHGTTVAYGLPPGLIINPKNGYITGTPLLGGSYQTTIVAKNDHGEYEQILLFSIVDILCREDGSFGNTKPEQTASYKCFLGIGQPSRSCDVDQETGGAIWSETSGNCAGDWSVLIILIVVIVALVAFVFIKRRSFTILKKANNTILNGQHDALLVESNYSGI
ncbi:hypothetical protein WA158_005074 [Blastocystis sp. Blastoise]